MGLLDLPKELRDHILFFVLIKPQNTITMLSNSHCLRSEVSAAQPVISKVCRQLRAETLPPFYSSNVFLAEVSRSDDLRTARNWLAAIGDGNVRHLRHLTLGGWTSVEHYDIEAREYLYVSMALDLREGELELEINHGVEQRPPTMMWSMDGLKSSFREMVDAKHGANFTVTEIGELMEGFHGVCCSL